MGETERTKMPKFAGALLFAAIAIAFSTSHASPLHSPTVQDVVPEMEDYTSSEPSRGPPISHSSKEVKEYEHRVHKFEKAIKEAVAKKDHKKTAFLKRTLRELQARWDAGTYEVRTDVSPSSESSRGPPISPSSEPSRRPPISPSI